MKTKTYKYQGKTIKAYTVTEDALLNLGRIKLKQMDLEQQANEEKQRLETLKRAIRLLLNQSQSLKHP